MLDLSFLYPLALAAALFILVVVGIVVVLRLSLARSIARSHAPAGPMPVGTSVPQRCAWESPDRAPRRPASGEVRQAPDRIRGDEGKEQAPTGTTRRTPRALAEGR